MNPKPFRIVPCSEWGAKPPKTPIPLANKPVRAIFHHTAGHAPHLDALVPESLEEAKTYARAIQSFHMAPGGLGAPRGGTDSGHNFLVCRNGYIFEGRHGSLAAVLAGKMVVSAHCPGQNDQPGVEIEHNGSEAMTAIQREAAVWLFAWICKHGGFSASNIYGHRQFFATACPGSLYAELPAFRVDVGKALKLTPTKLPKPLPKVPVYQVSVTDKTGHTTVVETRLPGVYLSKLGIVKRGVVSFSGTRMEKG